MNSFFRKQMKPLKARGAVSFDASCIWTSVFS